MPSSGLNLEEHLVAAREAALGTWREIARFYKGSYDIFEKHNDGPATEADILADRLIIEQLKGRYLESRYGYLSEEAEKNSERLGKELCWIVDPIDGTKDFIEGKGDFAVHIGLAGRVDGEDGLVPLVGVVYHPLPGYLYTAVRGAGAYVENVDSGERVRLEVTHQDRIAAMRLVVTRSHMGHRMMAAMRRLSAAKVSQRGSLGVKVCDVASGRADAYFNTSWRKCKEWDVCAPHAILTEAGGCLSDLRGGAIRYNKQDYHVEFGVLASNGRLHDDLVRELGSVKEVWE